MGLTGATGPIGPIGPVGPTGPTGGAALLAYGTFISNEARIIAIGGSVVLDSALAIVPVGMTFVPGGTAVTVTNAGIYRVQYSVRSDVGIVASIRLLINGVPLPNSELAALVSLGQRTGIATVSLVAGSTVGIGTTGLTVILPEGVNAFLDILRIA